MTIHFVTTRLAGYCFRSNSIFKISMITVLVIRVYELYLKSIGNFGICICPFHVIFVVLLVNMSEKCLYSISLIGYVVCCQLSEMSQCVLVKIMLKRRNESDTYLAADRRHCWSTQISMKVDKCVAFSHTAAFIS